MTSFPQVSTSMTLNDSELPKYEVLVIFWQFLVAAIVYCLT